MADRKIAVALIGCAGVPNRYGGFESFAEHIGSHLACNGTRVFVTCQKTLYRDDPASTFNGIERIMVPLPSNGALSPLHDFVAFLAVAWRVDRILVLGVSAGLFFPLFRFLASFCGAARFYVNVDGVEWRRDKYGSIKKLYLYLSDRLAQRFADGVILDNAELAPYVRTLRPAACIAYSGDHTLRARSSFAEVSKSLHKYALTICRIEPENNCEMLIEGFLSSSLERYIFVGNWNNSKYGKEIRKKYNNTSRLEFLDPIYDADTIHALRSNCIAYLHGHSVGGTNPSLVEMIYYDSPIFCLDVAYNRATAGRAALYFDNAAELGKLLSGMPYQPAPGERESIRQKYSAATIARQLTDFLFP